jgi:hypothetical protein
MSAEGSGGPPHGKLYIAWDDNFPPLPWSAPFELSVDRGPGSHTLLTGSANNVSFGEELVGGLDWDRDGAPDLFVGDLAANLPGRPSTGMSHIIYDARSLKGITSEIAELPGRSPPLRTTTIYGARPGDISGDTAAQGDFDGDGAPDLALCSPHSSPLRRAFAGSIQLLLGRAGGWPAEIDLQRPPDATRLARVPVYGAHGDFGLDRGDTLCYSAAAADLDADGLTDLISNEMVGNGLAPDSVDVGNLILLGGARMTHGPGPNPAR